MEKALTETPLRRFPYDAKLVVSNTIAAVVLSFLAPTSRWLHMPSMLSRVNPSAQPRTSSRVPARLVGRHASIARMHDAGNPRPHAVRISPSKTPPRPPALTLTQNEKHKAQAARFRHCLDRSLHRPSSCFRHCAHKQLDRRPAAHLEPRRVFALTAMQPFIWAGVVVAIKIRNARTRNQTSARLSP